MSSWGVLSDFEWRCLAIGHCPGGWGCWCCGSDCDCGCIEDCPKWQHLKRKALEGERC